MSIHDIPRSPITDTQRAMLRRRVANLSATAKRRGCTLDAYQQQREQQVAQQEFELGCWLYWASKRQYNKRREYAISIQERAQVTFMVLLTGRSGVGYDFYTAFEFGEREFDTFFETGDSHEVVCEVVKLVKASGNPDAMKSLQLSGWDHPKYEPSDLFSTAADRLHFVRTGETAEARNERASRLIDEVFAEAKA